MTAHPEVYEYATFVQKMVDQNKLGACEFFDSKPFIDAANILAASDDVLRALTVLDSLPGYYRDNPPPEITELKKKILKKMATPNYYMTNVNDMNIMADVAEHQVTTLIRGQQIAADVKAYNEERIIPHIVDLGPGDYWLPIGLAKNRLMFTYQPIGICDKAKDKALPFISSYLKEEIPNDRPQIFVACEIIEHLHFEEEITIEYNRVGTDAEVIHMSTPLYTFDGRHQEINWEKKDILQHLRTYTPDEFYQAAHRLFPKHKWEIIGSNILHARGKRVS